MQAAKHVRRFLRLSGTSSSIASTRLSFRYLVCTPSGFDVDSDLTSKNYFKVLGVPQAFDVSPAVVSARFKALQKEWHPDHHYSGASGTDPKKAAVISSLVNEAYKALKAPHTRAKHLLALLGEDEDPDMEPEFLAWVVEFREAIDDAEGNQQAVEKLAQEVDANIEALLTQLRASFSGENLADAASQTAQLKYMWRMRTALEDMS